MDGALAEIYYHLSRAPVMSSSAMRIHELKLSLTNVLRLDATALRDLGIEDPLATRADYGVSQAVGRAAYMLDYEGLVVPSARWPCENFVLFVDRIDINAQIALAGSSDVNWPAWKEANTDDGA